MSKPGWCLAGGIVSALFFFAFLALGIFSVGFIDNIIITKAAEGSALSAGNYKNWGIIPGNYDINVTRRYVFQNFENPFEVFYFNETPKFVETKSYLYQEHQNASDPVYSNEDSNGNPTVVDFNYQLYNLPLDASESDLVTTVNLGAVGLWYTAHTLSDAEMATVGFSALLESLKLDIPTTILGEGIQFQCITDQKVANTTLKNSNIQDPELQAWMWSDPVYGLSNLSSLNIWVHAISDGPLSGAAKILGDYFTLDNMQVISLLNPKGELGSCVLGLNDSIKNAYGCPTEPCEATFLVDLQWTSQEITMKPAGGKLDPKPSVVYFNSTVTGFPEISYYMTANFTKTYPVNQDQYNLTWPFEITGWLFNRTPSEGSPYCTNNDTLLNSGNLEVLFAAGQDFDAQNNITNLEPLQPIKDRFRLPSLEHAHVLWKYIDYIQGEFILRESLGGGRGQVLIGQFAGNALYQNFSTALDYLNRDLTAKLIWNNMTSNSMGCPELLVASTGQFDLEHAAEICQADILSPWDLDTLKFLIEACTMKHGEAYNILYNETNLTSAQVATFCGSVSHNTFGSMLQFSQGYLKEFYNCSSYYSKSKRCSNYELAAKQWADSTITLNVPPLLQANFTANDSLAGWYPDLFAKPFEYRAVLQILSKNFTLFEVEPVGIDTAKKLLTFDCLFGTTKVQSVLLYFENQMWSEFEETFYGLNAYHLASYFKYLMMDIALGGFSQTRTVKELLWGYNDSLLVEMKNKDPLDSGDPSVNTLINLAGQNSSYEDGLNYPVSMLTGMNDSSRTRDIVSFYGKDYITYLNSYFNGNEVINEYVTPWNGTIPFEGTDGAINRPNLKSSDNVTFYITDISFQTQLVYNGSQPSYNGVDTYTYSLPSDALSNVTKNPSNAKYYSDKWEGFINISKIHKAPLFVCKAHFLDADSTLAESVKIYNSDESQLITPNRAEDLHLDIEPYSGVPVNVMAGFQVNYQFQPDEFFTFPKPVMLPLVITYRGLAFSDAQIDSVFGPLKTGLFFKNYGPWIGFGAALIFAIVCIFCFLRRKKYMRESHENRLVEEVSIYRRMASNETRPPIEIVGSQSNDATPVRTTKLFNWNQDNDEADKKSLSNKSKDNLV